MNAIVDFSVDRRPAIVLDAAAHPRDVLARLMRCKDDDTVVVRRQHGLVVYHYAFRAGAVRHAVMSSGAPTLRDALHLHETDAAEMHEEGEHGPMPARAPVVVMRGDAVVDVAWPSAGGIAWGADPPSDAGDDDDAEQDEDDEDDDVATLRGRIAASDVAAPLARIAVDVGLGALSEFAGPSTGVIAVRTPGAMIALDVHLVVGDGLELIGPHAARLEVPRSAPGSRNVTFTVALPEVTGPEPLLTSLIALFVDRGHVCGVVTHKLVVSAVPVRAVHPADVARSWLTPSSIAAVSNIAPNAVAPDLTISITKPDRNSASGRFTMAFVSPHAALPPAATIDLGEDAASFAKAVSDQMPALDASPALFDLHVAGLAQVISDRLPNEMWKALRDVAAAIGRAPSVLLATEDPHVPWELATMPDPLIDPMRPSMFGAQVPVGRWLLGNPGPPLPPATSVDAKGMVVVKGDYLAQRGLRPLPEAMAEGTALAARWGAIELCATATDVVKLLGGTMRADIVHFACHGTASAPNPLHAAILLETRAPLHAHVFRSTALGRQRRPFLFLNACQVGTTGTALGSAAGFPSYSTMGGFRGFVGPLWLVDDATARAIAERFYDATLGQGVSAGEALRAARADAFVGKKATGLAYVFYGDPSLSLSLAKELT